MSDTDPAAAWSGGRFGALAECVLADNAGPITLDGTNTWILRAPDSEDSVVIDPGPLETAHLERVAERAGHVTAVLLTHGHLDHSEGARAFADRVGCGVRALDPTHQYGSEGLGDGDVIGLGDHEVRVVGTPGHTSDSLSFWVPSDGAILTGDTVLGRGTTVVAHPDGALGAYLDSLDRLHALAAEHEAVEIWPGHGPVIADALAALDYYLAHRKQRLEQVAAALPQIPEDTPAEELPRAVVERVYADVDRVLWGAAEMSVRAQIAYLQAR
ncbi:MBL fold metallo-hydrolase [Nocardioides insulae]|uniref:MBL fold metallo-hydrolase n=1 Tax=Nocardioides insulae TaxID=394734 RepID=UPI000413CBBD|nr:MBL fold metallo-hydrolase [Nocardioides insulae]